MAFTTEFTQAQVDQLTRNIGLGVAEMEHNGKRTRFQSMADMVAVRDRMKAELAAAAAAGVLPPKPIPCMTRRLIFYRS